MENKMTFRFDDVCANANMNLIYAITSLLKNKFEGCIIIYGVSPLVHDDCGERVYPKEMNAFSDHRRLFDVKKAHVPNLIDGVVYAGHGLVHVDHRLMHREAQELSILASCSLVKANMFIPPFNKYNKDTEDICREHDIELVKFDECGTIIWRSCEHNKFDQEHKKWYLHAREWTLESFKEWIEK